MYINNKQTQEDFVWSTIFCRTLHARRAPDRKLMNVPVHACAQSRLQGNTFDCTHVPSQLASMIAYTYNVFWAEEWPRILLCSLRAGSVGTLRFRSEKGKEKDSKKRKDQESPEKTIGWASAIVIRLTENKLYFFLVRKQVERCIWGGAIHGE